MLQWYYWQSFSAIRLCSSFIWSWWHFSSAMICFSNQCCNGTIDNLKTKFDILKKKKKQKEGRERKNVKGKKKRKKKEGKGKRKSIIFMCMTPYYYDSPKKAYTPHVLHLLIYYIYSLTLLQPFICPFYYNNCCLYRFIIYPFIILNCIFNFLLLQNMYFFFLSELED
jgi:hypothetical protein